MSNRSLRYPETPNKADGSENVRNQDQKLYYHYLGTDQKDDILIAEFPDDPLLNIVLDMLKFNKFTIGYFWESDYGSPANSSQFEYLLGYSPLHNIQGPNELKGKQYPATLLMTADHDDRVSPVHSLKFAATLQEKLRDYPHQTNPLLIRIETKAGHGGGKPTTKQVIIISNYLDFFFQEV
ncbi:prolyl endopeptidase-like [Diaphorina citri]|uniref:Prolyl endopeptidase n=1 Tax=Diaphorina citri TaxID=121845 RepID=A0A3Q0J920_DIACI|nr:prolyl endopeptidase-like [Diaphorina citri]